MTLAGRTYQDQWEEVMSFQFNEGKYLNLVKRWLNDAVRKIVLQSEIRTQEEKASITTTSGDPTYSLPEDFARLIDFFETSIPYRLASYQPPELDVFPASSGRPTSYTVIGNELSLWPSPDGPYSLALRYWRLPQDMVNPSDQPSLPVQYHDLPIAYAMMQAYARENDYNASTFWQQKWEAGLLKLRGEAQNDVWDGPQQLGGTWGGEPGWSTPLVWRP